MLQIAPGAQVPECSAAGRAAGPAGRPEARRPVHRRGTHCAARRAPRIADVLQAAGWPEETISREGLNWLKEKLIKSGDADSLRLEGVKEDRKPVIGGGLAVLCALFDLMQMLALTTMEMPQTLSPENIRAEKIKVLESIIPIPLGEIKKHAFKAQYGRGKINGD